MRVHWKLDAATVKRNGLTDAWEPYIGTVTAVVDKASGQRLHEVTYDDWNGPDAAVDHDFASSSLHRYQLILQPTSVTPPPPPAAPAPRLPVRRPPAARTAAAPTTRSQRPQLATALVALSLAAVCTGVPSHVHYSYNTTISDAVDELVCYSAEPVTTFNAAVYQFTGDDSIHATSIDDLERARLELRSSECSPTSFEASLAVDDGMRAIDTGLCAAKAEKAEVHVKHADGSVSVITVPSTARQLLSDPGRDKWLAADQKALDALLVTPGNRLVPTSTPRNAGLPVAPCVTTRKLKLDKATGNLDGHNAYKSRHAFDGNRHGALAEKMGVQTFEPSSSAVSDDLLVKITLANATDTNRSLTKLDVGDAFIKGERKRAPTYMALPATLPMFAADGSPLCIEFGGSPVWGETCASREWADTLYSGLCADGWKPAEDVPCCYRRVFPDGTDAFLITIVDDIMISETTGTNFAAAKLLLSQLEARYGRGEVKIEHEPTSFVGYSIKRNRRLDALTIDMAAPVEAAAREFIPIYVETGDCAEAGLPHGAKLRKMLADLTMAKADPSNPKLTPSQRRVGTIVGKLRWYEKCCPALTQPLHQLSCVTQRPPPEALPCAEALLALAYDLRFAGITFGGHGLHSRPRLEGHLSAAFNMRDGAHERLEATADATWDGDNVYSILLTYRGASVAHCCKKMHMMVDSSMESEAVATGKSGELIAYAREVLRAIGAHDADATFVGTDNAANALIASGRALPSRSRHCLRRYSTFLQRVALGETRVGHVPDPENPSDWLTKFVSKDKQDMSMRFATNYHNRVATHDVSDCSPRSTNS